MAGLFRTKGAAAALKKGLQLAAQDKRAEAFRYFASAAEKGVAEAEYQVACSYFAGTGVPASAAEGVGGMERAAGLVLLEAQTALAVAWLRGVPTAEGSANADRKSVGGDVGADVLGGGAAHLFDQVVPGQPDFARAVAWARRACEGGSAEAKAILAYILSSGPEEMRDLEQGDRLFREAAEAGSIQGHLGWGVARLRLAKSAEDSQAAAGHLKIAAAAQFPMALYLLGAMYAVGQGVEKDPEQAAACYRAAAEKGLRPAQARLGAALLQGHGVARDPVAAETWLRRAALAGDPE